MVWSVRAAITTIISKKLFMRNTRVRNFIKIFIFILFDISCVYLAIFIGLATRLEGAIPQYYVVRALWHGGFISAIFVLIFFGLGIYKSLWQYSGTKQYMKLVLGCTIAIIITFIIELSLPARLPISVLIITYLSVLILSGGFRIAYRKFYRWLKNKSSVLNIRMSPSRRVMVIGGGDAGSLILKEMLINPKINKLPVLVVDDDKTKHGRNIHGVRIEYGTERIAELAKKYQIYEIVFAIPSASPECRKSILDTCISTKCELSIMPGISELYNYHDYRSLSHIVRKVKVEDLLGREEVNLDLILLSNYLADKTILITGGGGSIGSEIARQVIKFHPARLLVLDIYENNAAKLLDELKIKYGNNLEMEVIIASVRDIERLEQLFKQYRPHLVFHAAAHKHVPLMEANPHEAVKNNVIGTLNVAKMADKYKTSRFILISTDKAVNPANVMGATKRIAEMIIQSMDSISNTEFAAVRFGNVLDSNGSVIPLFRKQIESGGPVTVTHPDIQRYFMTIPEAAQLVLQAGAMAKGGEIFVLDMGNPVKIMDLAANLIKLSGLNPGTDIKIEIIGLRPGEKMYEELLLDEEGVDRTRHQKVMIGKTQPCHYENLIVEIDRLVKCVNKHENILNNLAKIVPSYNCNKDINLNINESKNKEIISS